MRFGVRGVRRWLGVVAASLVLWLAACGGGGGGIQIAAPGVVGTGPAAISVGTLTGFGSIIVNGVEFEDDGARVTDEDDNPRSTADLRLGMVVEVRGEVSDQTPTGRANTIRIVNQVRGTVESVETAAGRFEVLGTTIRTSPQTVYEGLADVSSLRAGDTVEVSGYFDRSRQLFNASRVERTAAIAAGQHKAQGVVAALDTAAKQFRLDTLTVDYGGATLKRLSTGLANGRSVKVKGQLGADGRFIATEVQGQEPEVQEAVKLTLEGVISDFAGRSDFKIDEQRVDASEARFEGGRVSDLADGVSVRIAGDLRNGVLQAKTVEIRRPEVSEPEEFELKGPIASFGALSSFKVKGQLVDASDAVIEGGTVRDLRNGVKVEIKGRLVSAAGVSVLKARQVKIDD